jgi:hypothetical protein
LGVYLQITPQHLAWASELKFQKKQAKQVTPTNAHAIVTSGGLLFH